MSSVDIVSSKIASVSLPGSHPSSILSISPLLPVLSSRIRSHDVCMLNWLLVGEGDIWAANYYVLSCCIPLMTQSLSLNISGQDWVFSQGNREKKCVYYEPECIAECNLFKLLTAHCVPRHVNWNTWNSECSTFSLFFVFFLNLSVKELTFHLDVIFQREWIVLYLLSWCWGTLQLNQPSYISRSHRPTEMS